jgi:hypothetical protein
MAFLGDEQWFGSWADQLAKYFGFLISIKKSWNYED